MAHRLQHATNLAIAPFRDGDAIPAIGAFTTSILDRTKRSHAVVQPNAVQQVLFFFVAQGSQDAHGIFPLQSKPGVHQLVGQLTRAGEQKQTLSVQIQATDGLPFALLQTRKLAKHRRPVLRVIVGNHLANRLVVSNNTRRWRINAIADRLAIHLHLIAKLHALTNVCRLVVHRDPAFKNQLLHLQTRAQPGLRKHLVKFGRFHLRQQHALGCYGLATDLIGIETTRNDIFKLVTIDRGSRRSLSRPGEASWARRRLAPGTGLALASGRLRRGNSAVRWNIGIAQWSC